MLNVVSIFIDYAASHFVEHDFIDDDDRFNRCGVPIRAERSRLTF